MGYAFIGEGAHLSAPGPSGKIGLINQNTVGSLQGQVPEQTGPFHPPAPEQDLAGVFSLDVFPHIAVRLFIAFRKA